MKNEIFTYSHISENDLTELPLFAPSHARSGFLSEYVRTCALEKESRGEDRADVLLTDKKLAIEFQKADFSGADSDTCGIRSA